MSAYVQHIELIAERLYDPDGFVEPMSVSVSRSALLADDLSKVDSVVTTHAIITRPDINSDEGEEKTLHLYRDDVVWLLDNLPAVLALMPEDEVAD